MTVIPPEEALAQLATLLKMEKEEDYAQYQQKMQHTSIKERKDNGVTWYPVVVANQYISTGERVTLELEKTTEQEQKHAFQVGALVSVFVGTDEKARSVSGVISRIKKGKMRVALNVSDFPNWLNDDKAGVNLMFDESTYRAMDAALHTVMKAEDDRLATLRNLMYGVASAQINNGHAYQSIHLNEKQNEALSAIFNAEDLAIVHGPPGTGKTTTLVHAIKDTVNYEKQVLVCAQSNAAVDLLVERLHSEGLEVLRLGHPARLTPEAIENSLDVKISKHPYFKDLKEVRRKSEAVKQMALKFKRNFGREERHQRSQALKEARLLREEADKIERYITDSLLQSAQVVASTLVGANHTLLERKTFKTVFIDEASQALEPACWIPIIKAHRVVMAGDHQQLPPTVKSIKAAKDGLANTLFEKCIVNQPSAVMLETQYRMHPYIMRFSSQFFYDNKLKAAEAVLQRPAQTEGISFEFIDTAGCGFEEKVKKETRSTYNPEEAALLAKHLHEAQYGEALSIGIIAPYKAQIENIGTQLANLEQGEMPPLEVSVNTVDAFQGQERDIIYISLTRSNDKGEIGFLKEYRRMNVAMTRARYKLVVIGDSATLGHDAFYGQIVGYAQEIEGYKSAFEFLY